MTKAEMKKVIKKQAEELFLLKNKIGKMAEVEIHIPNKLVSTKYGLILKDGKNAVVSLKFDDGGEIELNCKPLEISKVWNSCD